MFVFYIYLQKDDQHYIQAIRGCGKAVEEAVLHRHRKLITLLCDMMSTSVHHTDDTMLVLRALNTVLDASDLNFATEAGLWKLIEKCWREVTSAKSGTVESRYGCCMFCKGSVGL